jgi:hypothetical protein
METACAMEKSPSPVFRENIEGYLDRISEIDLPHRCRALGGTGDKEGGIIPLLGTPYRISRTGITGPGGERAPYATSIILFKHLLLCPGAGPEEGEWVSYRDFRDAAPLLGYFGREAEGAIAGGFAGDPGRLDRACRLLGALPPDMDLSYDIALAVPALPRIPVLLLFNDAEEGFPADCLLRFRRRTERCIDMESLGMLGALLAKTLLRA